MPNYEQAINFGQTQPNQAIQMPGANAVLQNPTSDPNEVSYINSILNEYKDKNFVDRIINKDKYPSLDIGGGNSMTHYMGYDEHEGQYIVYPHVVWDGSKLQKLEPGQAKSHALKTGEYIPFNSDQEANWFSQNYKQVWGHSGVKE